MRIQIKKYANIDKNKYVGSNLYILSKQIKQSRICPVPGCDGNGNKIKSRKTHYKIKFCPKYDQYFKNTDIIKNVVELSEDIKKFDFQKYHSGNAINYDDILLDKSNQIKKLEKLNEELNKALVEKTEYIKSEQEIYNRYKVLSFFN